MWDWISGSSLALEECEGGWWLWGGSWEKELRGNCNCDWGDCDARDWERVTRVEVVLGPDPDAAADLDLDLDLVEDVVAAVEEEAACFCR